MNRSRGGALGVQKLNSATELIRETKGGSPLQGMYYIGLDVHKRTISYCVGRCDHREGSIPCPVAPQEAADFQINVDITGSLPSLPTSGASAIVGRSNGHASEAVGDMPRLLRPLPATGRQFLRDVYRARRQRSPGGAEVLVEMLQKYDGVEKYAEPIKDLEHAGDNLTHTLFTRLNQTFITPFDREDIQSLSSRIDDVLDLI